MTSRQSIRSKFHPQLVLSENVSVDSQSGSALTDLEHSVWKAQSHSGVHKNSLQEFKTVKKYTQNCLLIVQCLLLMYQWSPN